MSEALMRVEPEPRAPVAPERTSGVPSEAATPPAAPAAAERTTYDPHDRVPLADAEEEC